MPSRFFIWRFLARGFWWTAHPFSLSAVPDGRSLRITVKELGDHTSRIGDIPIGTRVVAEGPFGVFTEAVRKRRKLALVAGGIGITPVRALLEEFRGDVITVYRALTERDLVLRGEIDDLVQRHGGRVERGRRAHRLTDHTVKPKRRVAACPGGGSTRPARERW